MAPIMTERPEFPSVSSASEILCEDGAYIVPKQPPSPGPMASVPSSMSSLSLCESPGPVATPATTATTSILATMETFVRVIDEMHDTILIPSKLRDMELGVCNSSSGSSSSVMALVPQQQGGAAQPPPDLLAYYNTLSAIKTELVNGQSSEDDSDSDSDCDSDSGKGAGEEKEPAFQAAAAFRHHLQGLFGVLQQLTGTAKLLTTRYQEEIGEAGAGPATPLAAFTL
jgi:hypothetical protein